MNMTENEEKVTRAILCGVHTGDLDVLSDTTEESMAELAELAKGAGALVVGTLVQNKDKPENKAYLGEGKLEELRLACETLEADLIIFDDELTGIQTRNIEDITGVRTIDRSTLILDIFALRARSREGKLQVELAQLRYRLPRLTGMGAALSRLGGGIGTRGPGETKLENDKRHIRRRIEALEEELRDIERHRNLIRSRRSKDGVLTCTLAGYTNAGKSSLLNALTGSEEVYAANQLFATLDPTARAITLPDGRSVMLVDTVGFIRKLPHHLVKAFRSTLEETIEADVILHVIDSADPDMCQNIRVVDSLIRELDCKAEKIIAVFNKCDIAPALSPRPEGHYTDFVSVSTVTGEGIEELVEKISDALPGKKKRIEVLIPYSDSGVAARLHDGEVIFSEEYTDTGIKVDLLADEILEAKLKNYITH
ncbi:MAG: GTPase HflX [Clostridia bacterium]|nr:GTPase HflX [Clostridia bacterium]